jgi:hypothetical protein
MVPSHWRYTIGWEVFVLMQIRNGCPAWFCLHPSTAYNYTVHNVRKFDVPRSVCSGRPPIRSPPARLLLPRWCDSCITTHGKSIEIISLPSKGRASLSSSSRSPVEHQREMPCSEEHECLRGLLLFDEVPKQMLIFLRGCQSQLSLLELLVRLS